ncbi:rRNA biogenesis protein RRP5 [Candida viswanathii]|uniref:rRNA biogenesis protein RRP5 n=1 Tax=Candida viswanathii TaxID=5486 RepID=A0A367XMI8_9ASCO|nr:rRNA biogenesis protein RRP5 [Candida viswanathii]
MSDSSKSVLSNKEFAFPRGGSKPLSALEVKEISNEAIRDVLFEQGGTNKRPASGKSDQQKKKQKKQSSKKKSKGDATEQDAEETKSIPVENFNFKNIVNGTWVLGQIKAINKLDIALALGDNLVGYIPITSISPQITQLLEDFDHESSEEEEEEEDDEGETIATIKTKAEKEFPELRSIFKLGSWLKAKVSSSNDDIRTKKRIELTIEPETVNENVESDDLLVNNVLQCAVKSVEDHGVILDTGKAEYSGFIGNKELKNANIDVDSIKPGLVILSAISSKVSGRTINFKPASSVSVKKGAVTTISSIDSIQPGVIVDALINDVTENGLITKVYGLVDGTIALSQIQNFDIRDLKHKYTIGANIKARVLAVLLKNGTKKLILSILPHVLQLGDNSAEEKALEAFPVGHVFDQVKVVGNDTNYIYVEFGSSSLFGQIHNSKIDDDKTLLDYSIGSTHKSRVIGFNEVDNLLILTFESKTIDAAYLKAQDIPIGTLLSNVEIVKVLEDGAGINVKVFDDFKGFVPANQMSDIKLVYPERKFRVGTKVKGRLLDNKGKRIYITLRKSLVNLEDDEILSSFDQAEIGFKTNAIVEKFVPNGCIVKFFGNLRAFLPKTEISETFVDNASNHLKLGQIVKVRILDINKDSERLIVTLKQSSELSNAQKNEIGKLESGKSIVSAIIVEKTKDSILVELEGSNLRGVIADGQLSDGNYEQNRSLAKKLKVGEKLEVLILDKDLKARTVIATAKASLIEAVKSKNFPTDFSDIQVNKVLKGYIKSVTNLGLFVTFAGRLTGLILAKYVTKNAKEDLTKKFYKFQSVTCRVISIDQENERFLLTLGSGGANSNDDEELVNPIDKTKKIVADYTPGASTKALIKAIKGTQLNVQLADNLQGRVDITQCFNSIKDIKNENQPLSSSFNKGDLIDVKVIGIHDAKNHTFLPITHRKSNKATILELSLTDKKVNSKSLSELKLEDFKAGDELLGFVNNIGRGFVWVSISPSIKGRISFLDLSNDGSIFQDIDNKLPIGSAIKVHVKQVDSEHNTLVLSTRDKFIEKFEDVQKGETYPARVIKIKPNHVLVELGPNVIASSFVTDALEDYSDKLDHVYEANDYVSAQVLDIDEDNNRISVSLRDESDSKDKVINSVSDLDRGQVIKGFIKNIANNGVYVSLGRAIHALVRISDLSDSYLKDWKKFFKPNQMVVGKIVNCKEEGRILMTLKESEVNGELKLMKGFDDLSVGDIFEGTVTSTTDFGVFVKLDGTVNISGLCHHTEIAENDVDNVKLLFGDGDRVKVKILRIDPEKKQLSLGMKASYFASEEEQGEESEEEEDVEMQDAEAEEEDKESESDDDEEEGDDDDDVMNVDQEESEGEESDEEEEETKEQGFSTGLSTNGFDWTASILDQAEDEEDSSDDEDDNDFTSKSKKKSKNKKKSQGIVEDKTGDLNTRAPQSVSDFERLLIGNPNSSILWMNYMSFQLQLSEVEKAREIGQRALKTINYREEQEKLNIWIALLNLENTFGTDETLEDVFKKAVQYMDAFVIHQKLVNIYIISEKFDQANELFKVMIKKFGKNISSWVMYGSFLLDQHLNDEIHEVLSKGLSVLPKRDHIELVKKFAQLEFNKGDAEQGRSLFEGLIADAPKRIDLWNIYIDQEIKKLAEDNASKGKVEELFERVLGKKISRKQAKFFFNKWLSYEEGQEDENMITRVKAKAAEYVQNNS